MGLHGRHADAERLAELRVATPLGEQAQDLLLRRGERDGCGGGGGVRRKDG